MTTSKLKRFGIPAALVVGGVTAGSFFSPIGLASAQDDESDTGADTTNESESGEYDDDTDRQHRGWRHRRGPGAEAMAEALGLTQEEIRQGFQDGKSLADLAAEQGVAIDDLKATLVAEATRAIDDAVADEKLDPERAEEMKAGLDERIDTLINQDPSERRAHHHRPFGRLGATLDELEETLGLTAEEIRDGLADGKSLADMAEEQGVSVEDLAAQLTAGLEERIDDAVRDGKMDPERAAAVKERLDERVDRAINAEPFALGRMTGRAEGRALRHHHRFGHHGDHDHGFGPGHEQQGDAESGDAESGDAEPDVEGSSY